MSADIVETSPSPDANVSDMPLTNERGETLYTQDMLMSLSVSEERFALYWQTMLKLVLVDPSLTRLPLFAILDMIALVSYGPLALFKSQQDRSDRLTEIDYARMSYESKTIFPLFHQASFRSALELCAQDPFRQAHLVKMICSRISNYLQRQGVESVYSLRECKQLSAKKERSTIAQCVQYTQASLLIPYTQILNDQDLFELANFEVLSSEQKRIGVRQINEVYGLLLENRLPTVRLRPDPPEVLSLIQESTSLPIGGYEGLTNKGSIENLSRSEAVYIQKEALPGVSLFTMRMAEGELLYLKRAEGHKMIKRRKYYFILHTSELFYVKSPGYSHPFSAMLLGMIKGLYHAHHQLMQQDKLQFEVVIVGDPHEQKRAQEEIALLELALHKETEAGRVVFSQWDLDIFDEEVFKDLFADRCFHYLTIFDSGSPTGSNVDKWKSALDSLSPRALKTIYLTLGGPASNVGEEVANLPTKGLSQYAFIEVFHSLYTAFY